MVRIFVAVALVTAAPAVPVIPTSAVAAETPTTCADTPQKKAKRSLFGGILGTVAGSVVGSVGGTAGSIAAAALPAASYLGDELLRMLDCKEQQQAARATDEAIRGGVGTESSWQSETRANVHGSSKVTAAEASADGGQCLTVTDVVIVDGEETTVPKKMCRAPGQSAYVKV